MDFLLRPRHRIILADTRGGTQHIFGAPLVLYLRALEGQPCLEFNYASSQSPAGLSKLRAVEGCAGVVLPERNQVQFVEKVEQIDTQVQLGTLTLEKGHGRRFDETHVNPLVARTTERIAMNERRPDSASIKVRKAN